MQSTKRAGHAGQEATHVVIENLGEPLDAHVGPEPRAESEVLPRRLQMCLLSAGRFKQLLSVPGTMSGTLPLPVRDWGET